MFEVIIFQVSFFQNNLFKTQKSIHRCLILPLSMPIYGGSKFMTDIQTNTENETWGPSNRRYHWIAERSGPIFWLQWIPGWDTPPGSVLSVSLAVCPTLTHSLPCTHGIRNIHTDHRNMCSFNHQGGTTNWTSCSTFPAEIFLLYAYISAKMR